MVSYGLFSNTSSDMWKLPPLYLGLLTNERGIALPDYLFTEAKESIYTKH